MKGRVGWHQLPKGLRDSIEERVGEFLDEQPVSSGHNCLIGLRLQTRSGTYFLKGVPAERAPAVRTQRLEQIINPYVTRLSPRLVFYIEYDGWSVLGFRFLDGYRHANLAPGSPDLAKVAATLRMLARVDVPSDVEIRRAEQRYAAYAGGNADVLAGTTLCHTDLNKHNILITDSIGRSAKLVDWAWPTAGAPWIDTACVILQLIEAGHSPMTAEDWGKEVAAFKQAADADVSLFVTAIRNLWTEIGETDPQPWKLNACAAAQQWAEYRTGRHRRT